MPLDRAYSMLEIRAVDDDARVIEGVASTPTADRMGDIVVPEGAKFALPMPLLWQHDSHAPIGEVTFAKPTKGGIPFKARLVHPDDVESESLKDRLREAWDSIKTGLVRAVSIGFRDLAHEVMKDGGWRFTEWEWLELSAVTIPANADATITTIKSLDRQQLAASGHTLPTTARRDPPGASGSRPKPNPTKAPKEGTMTKKTVAEQISAFEATRVAKAARMVEIMDQSAEDGATLDAEQTEEYDTLDTEVKDIDAHLVRLRALEKAQVSTARPVDGSGAEAASEARGGVTKVIGSVLPKGIAFARFAIALARAQGNRGEALSITQGQIARGAWADTPQLETILKTAVAAGTTTDATWAAPLVEYQQMAGEFIELLRPKTILGRIPGLRNVPFNISMPGQTTGSSVGWVGEAKAKPVSKLTFDTTTLRWAKAAGIVVLTDELVRFSNPSAEAIVRDDMAGAIAQFLDEQLLNPDVAEVVNVSPASITHGVTAIPASGPDADDLRTDVKAVFQAFIAANLSPAGAVWIMSETMALAIGMMQNALGQPEFPGLGVNGGTFFGLPVITSSSSALDDGGSPDGHRLILVKASEILVADDGQIMIDVSREASLQMDSEPDEPTAAGTVMVSLWQRNMVGIRAERWINWKRRRTAAVQYITGANYGDAA